MENKKFTVWIVSRKTINVEATSYADAATKVANDHPGYYVDEISDSDNNIKCVNTCESCEKPIIEDEDHYTDPDNGYHICKPCISSMKG